MSAEQKQFREGDKVRTAQGEPATIYMLHPSEPYCVLTMDDQFMKDGGQAFRSVPLDSIAKVST